MLIRTFLLPLVALVAACGGGERYVSDDGRLAIQQGTTSNGSFRGVETTAALVDFQPMDPNTGQLGPTRSHVEVATSTPLGKTLVPAVLGGIGPAAVSGAFGVWAANEAGCKDDCGNTHLTTVASSGSFSHAQQQANASAAAQANNQPKTY